MRDAGAERAVGMRAVPRGVRRPARSRAPLWLAAPWVASLACSAPHLVSESAPAVAPPAVAVGRDVCRSCHPVETGHWDETIHARVLAERPRNEREARACEACHGAGSRHVADPSDRSAIAAFTWGSARPVEVLNDACLACHAGGARLHWRGSEHEVQGLACSDCHNPMAEQSARGLLAGASVSETCFRCHPQQRVDFRKRSHMPLLEGRLSCADCHDPHGSIADPLLRADTVNQLCTGCHADKRGPFLWEHAPVVDSCLSCHRPHGSNRASLLVAEPPFLCHQCHSQVASFSHPNDFFTAGNLPNGAAPDERGLGRGCVNCHAQIHGSNHPSGARFHR